MFFFPIIIIIIIMADQVSYVIGDIVADYSEKPNVLIVQQNNCTARRLHVGSLAMAIAQKFYPNCDPYARRAERGTGLFDNLARPEHREKMGDIFIFDNGPDRARVASLFAQYRMGNPHKQYYTLSPRLDDAYKKTPDDSAARLRAFRQCLLKLSREMMMCNIDTIAFPHKIGCNMAGGNWADYTIAIEEFAREISKVGKKSTNVIIVIRKNSSQN